MRNLIDDNADGLSWSYRVERSYPKWAEELVEAGWEAYILTFLFNHIDGSEASRIRSMEREIERVYAKHVTFVCRCPNAPSAIGRLPIWLCAPDFPVFKYEKTSLDDVSINDGLHMHAIALYPPRNRLTHLLHGHFMDRRPRYIWPGTLLRKIHVALIVHGVGYVTKYVRKAVEVGRAAEEATFILPRAHSEITCH